jgi:hypothetical protein
MVSSLRHGSAQLTLLALLSGCTLHSVAEQWHGRTGVDGRPVHLLTTTIVGFNLLVIVPFLGDPRASTLIDAATRRLEQVDGQRLRVVETESSNYWFALPPLSWFVSPVIGSVSIEYERPSPSAPEGF